MSLNKKAIIFVVLLTAGIAAADTFKHKESGDVFNGFPTQKSIGGKTRAFNADTNSFVNVALEEYDVAYNLKGRTDRVILIQITSPEILLSDKISRYIAKGIIDSSNRGPKLIIVQIDNPGGRSEYMKRITNAILDTTNCPVVAFISGGDIGGAFGAATAIAMACEKVYIATDGILGSVGPIPANLGQEQYRDYLKTYTPESLSSPYMISYLKNLARQRNRPELLVRGLVDKYVSVVEVVRSDGERQFVQQDDLQPTQTIIQTLCEGLIRPSGGDSSTIEPSDLTGAILTLTSDEAAELGLSESPVSNVKDILAALTGAEAKLGNLPGIDKMIKKYNAAKRNITQSLLQIQYLEEEANSLERQFATLDEQLATATFTRQTTSNNRSFSSYSLARSTLPSNWTGYYNPTYGTGQDQRQGSGSRRYNTNRTTITIEEPLVDITVVQQRFAQSLQLVIAEYRRTINLSKRWPGALPPEVTRDILEANANSAQQQLTRLLQYQPIYQIQDNIQNQGFIPRNDRNRGRR